MERCASRLVATARFTTASKVSAATLSRGLRVVARGALVRSGKRLSIVLVRSRRVARGAYLLRASGRRWRLFVA